MEHKCNRSECIAGCLAPTGQYWAMWRDGRVALVADTLRQVEVGACRGNQCLRQCMRMPLDQPLPDTQLTG